MKQLPKWPGDFVMGNRIFLAGRSINFSLSRASVIGGIYTNKFSLGYFNRRKTKTVPV